MRRETKIAFAMLVWLIVLACAPKVIPEVPLKPELAAPPREPTTVDEKPAWEEKWEKMVTAAKAERQMIFYSVGGPVLRDALIKGFKERYGIGLEVIQGKGAMVREKIISERRAGIYLADVVSLGPSTMTVLKQAGVLAPLEKEIILPEVLDLQNWLPGEPTWLDKEHTMLAYAAEASGTVGINTNLVKPGEIKSLRDLLHPKWKGKIILHDPTTSGAGNQIFSAVLEREGPDIWRQIAKQEPILLRDLRMMAEWVARGKYAVLIGSPAGPVVELIAAGAPIVEVNLAEGNYKSGNAVGLVNKAPHPNAARVFINWFLTKEGQTIYTSAHGRWTARSDVHVDGLEQSKIIPGVEYFDARAMDFQLRQEEYTKIAEEIFGPLKK